MKKTPAALAFVVLALAALACGNAGTPSQSAPTPINYAGPGYLWIAHAPQSTVPVISPVHQVWPGSVQQLLLWRDAGEVCAVAPGTKVGPDAGPKPFGGWSVEVLEGPCKGFRGWVDFNTWHPDKP